MQYQTGFHSFLFPDSLQDPFLSVSCIGIEQRYTTDYYFDNSRRSMDSFLFQYTLKGYGIFEQGGAIHEIRPGNAFFIHIPEDEKYYMPKNTQDDPWEFIFILLEGEHAARYYQLLTEQMGNILSMPFSCKPVQTLFDIMKQAQAGRIDHSFFVSELAYRFLCQLGQHLLHSPAGFSKRTQAAIRIMEHRYGSLQGIEEIAVTLGVSLSHFTREFHHETGIAPIKFLTNIRLTNAMKLLRETDFPIATIAEKCGFSTGNYFSKVFRRHMDRSPQEFRTEWQSFGT